MSRGASIRNHFGLAMAAACAAACGAIGDEVASLSYERPGISLRGELHCAAPGGNVSGQMDVGVDVSPVSAPRRKDGPGPAGRYHFLLVMNGTQSAEATGEISGELQVSGTFSPMEGTASSAAGAGWFKGLLSRSARSVIVEIGCPALTWSGEQFASPQPFALRLPPMRLEPAVSPAAGETPTGAGQPPQDETSDEADFRFTGNWMSADGLVQLGRHGHLVKGVCPRLGRTLEGTTAGDVLTFHWQDAKGAKGGGRWQLAEQGTALVGTIWEGADDTSPGQPFKASRMDGQAAVGAAAKPAEPTEPTQPDEVVTVFRTGAGTDGQPLLFREFALKEAAELDQLTVTFNAKPDPRPILHVQVSLDGQAWAEVFVLRDETLGGPDEPLHIALDGVRARYLRLQLDAGGMALLERYEVHAR